MTSRKNTMFKITSVQYFETAKEALETITPPSVTEIKEVNGEQELVRTIEDLNNIVVEQNTEENKEWEDAEHAEIEKEAIEDGEIQSETDPDPVLPQEPAAGSVGEQLGAFPEQPQDVAAVQIAGENTVEDMPTTATTEEGGDQPQQEETTQENTEGDTAAEGQPAGEETPAQSV